MPQRITYTALEHMPLIAPGDDIAAMIVARLDATDGLQAGDILVIAQKIVSKAEGRYIELANVVASPRATALAAATGKDPRYLEVVLSESSEIIRHRKDLVVAVHKRGWIMANAGIDESNIETVPGGRVLLLPEDPDATCAALKTRLDAHFGVSVGIIINDSFGRPWRNGVTGVALGAAGVPALRDLAGEPDMFGRPMRITEVAIADELAAAASLLMGQAGEGRPIIHVRGFRAEAPARPASALIRDKARDMFR